MTISIILFFRGSSDEEEDITHKPTSEPSNETIYDLVVNSEYETILGHNFLSCGLVEYD